MLKNLTKAVPVYILALALVMCTVFIWSAAAAASEPFLGEIKMFAGNFAPRNYALCDGQLLAISQNDALFSLFGTTYGGDGRTTFGLPDMRGRLVMHAGSGPSLSTRYLGMKSGTETNTLTANNLPAHIHAATVHAYGGSGNTDAPTGAVWAKKLRDLNYSTLTPDVTMNTSAVIVNNAGEQSPASVNNMPPFLVVNYIVALYGIYPSRN